ncbi:hypothetical protein N7528_007553 [Penicillium herquei]|nr:hypothetical protein N7528_007553 [Penicillium herquei]
MLTASQDTESSAIPARRLPTSLEYWTKLREKNVWAKGRKPAAKKGRMIRVLKTLELKRAPIPRKVALFNVRGFHEYIDAKRANIEALLAHMVGDDRCSSCIERKGLYHHGSMIRAPNGGMHVLSPCQTMAPVLNRARAAPITGKP